jgi:hypothetical protein
VEKINSLKKDSFGRELIFSTSRKFFPQLPSPPQNSFQKSSLPPSYGTLCPGCYKEKKDKDITTGAAYTSNDVTDEFEVGLTERR